MLLAAQRFLGDSPVRAPRFSAHEQDCSPLAAACSCAAEVADALSSAPEFSERHLYFAFLLGLGFGPFCDVVSLIRRSLGRIVRELERRLTSDIRHYGVTYSRHRIGSLRDDASQ